MPSRRHLALGIVLAEATTDPARQLHAPDSELQHVYNYTHRLFSSFISQVVVYVTGCYVDVILPLHIGPNTTASEVVTCQ